MVADKGKKAKHSEKAEDDNSEVIDEKLVISIEKLQEIQDELEKVLIQCLYALSLYHSFLDFLFSRAMCLVVTRREMKRSGSVSLWPMLFFCSFFFLGSVELLPCGNWGGWIWVHINSIGAFGIFFYGWRLPILFQLLPKAWGFFMVLLKNVNADVEFLLYALGKSDYSSLNALWMSGVAHCVSWLIIRFYRSANN